MEFYATTYAVPMGCNPTVIVRGRPGCLYDVKLR